MFDFPKADPVERGCGDRVPGGVYLESGLSPCGRPLEEFLIDPPLPVPDGLDLINKPQLWRRTLPSGDPVCDTDEQPIYDVLIWVGQEHYPYCPDFIEEVRRYGASRRLNPNLNLSRLSRWSRMILVHPRARNLAWQTQTPPALCHKEIADHVLPYSVACEQEQSDSVTGDTAGEKAACAVLDTTGAVAKPGLSGARQQPPLPTQEGLVRPQNGPCLFKVWELIPQEAAQMVFPVGEEEGSRDVDGENQSDERGEPDEGQRDLNSARLTKRPLCLRRIGSTLYHYRPTGESAAELVPGLFAALPLTGVALIRFADGSVNERAHEKVKAGRDIHGELALPWYESDR